MPRPSLPAFMIILPSLTLTVLTGCSGPATNEADSSKKTVNGHAGTPASGEAGTAPVVHRPVNLATDKPNELGRVPILEYHHVEAKEGRWTRTPDNFRKDLERLRKSGYVPVSMMEYVKGEMNLPPGKSPVIFTFDDSDPGQFRYLGAGESATLDPNCAVAIMRDFTRKHPDFPAKATFYVLPSLFEQRAFRERKLRELHEWGFEIGNHTYSHIGLRKLSRQQGMTELAKGVGVTTKVLPDYEVQTIALPLGSIPKDDSILRGGAAEGTTYKHHAALLVGAEPAPSPFAATYKPFRIPRIQATESVEPTLDYWLTYLEKNPSQRYRSDGDPATVTFPKKFSDRLNVAKTKGKTVRAY